MIISLHKNYLKVFGFYGSKRLLRRNGIKATNRNNLEEEDLAVHKVLMYDKILTRRNSMLLNETICSINYYTNPNRCKITFDCNNVKK